MEFGIVIPPHSRHVAEDAKFAEDQGFTQAWFADEPVGHGDVFVSMALAAAATREMKVGAGIACASNRITPATANSIATLNAIAPGRVILGFGSGSGSRAALGLPPLKLGEVRKQLEVIRQLLSNGEATYEEEGRQRKIRFINLDLELIKLTPRIPLYVAASAPMMATLAGEFGDGFISFGPPVLETVTYLLSQVRAGARNAGRENDRFPCVWMTGVCVLHPGETLESPRVVNNIGWWVLAILKILALVTALDLEKVPRI